MNKERTWPYTLLLLLIIACGVTLFFLVMERVEVEQKTGWSRAAMENPYLALGRFLEKVGYQTRSFSTVSDLTQMPPANAALFFPGSHAYLSKTDYDDLLHWVDNGGFLFIAYHQNDAEVMSQDPLLDAAQIQGFSSPNLSLDQEVTYVDEDAGRRLQLEMPSENGLRIDNQEDSWWLTGAADPILAATSYGKGTIYVAADPSFLDNKLLGEKDNAAFVWHLLEEWDPNLRDVWIIFKPKFTSFWGKFFMDHKIAWLSLFLCTVFVLWTKMPRFGPMLPDPPLARRSLLEFVNAFGHFVWSRHRGDVLQHATERAFWQRLSARRPTWHRLPKEQRNQKLGELTQMSKEEVAFITDNSMCMSAQEFTQKIELLENARRKL